MFSIKNFYSLPLGSDHKIPALLEQQFGGKYLMYFLWNLQMSWHDVHSRHKEAEQNFEWNCDPLAS